MSKSRSRPWTCQILHCMTRVLDHRSHRMATGVRRVRAEPPRGNLSTHCRALVWCSAACCALIWRTAMPSGARAGLQQIKSGQCRSSFRGRIDANQAPAAVALRRGADLASTHLYQSDSKDSAYQHRRHRFEAHEAQPAPLQRQATASRRWRLSSAPAASTRCFPITSSLGVAFEKLQGHPAGGLFCRIRTTRVRLRRRPAGPRKLPTGRWGAIEIHGPAISCDCRHTVVEFRGSEPDHNPPFP
jgi:hypothetical protein